MRPSSCFAAAVAAAAIVPVSAHAAGPSTVVIGNPNNNSTAVVTQTHQLQTTIIAPKDVLHFAVGIAPGTCGPVYTPPTGKAIVVTQITYDLGSGAQGTESYGELATSGCSAIYDIGDTVQAYEAQSHTFPTGLPMPSVYINNGSSVPILVTLTGYLIPATQLPEEGPQAAGPIKGLPNR